MTGGLGVARVPHADLVPDDGEFSALVRELERVALALDVLTEKIARRVESLSDDRA